MADYTVKKKTNYRLMKTAKQATNSPPWHSRLQKYYLY
jgi:hypothetical protein